MVVYLSPLLLFSVITFSSIAYYLYPNGGQSNAVRSRLATNSVCSTRVCRETAIRVRESLNEKIDPCDDFYHYACGNWLANNPLPAHRAHWSPLDMLEMKIKKQLKTLFEKKRKERPTYEKITYKLYEDCLRQNSMSALNNVNVSSAALRRLLKKFGGWPLIQKRWKFNFSLERVYGYIRSSFGVNWILGVYLYTETEGNAMRTLLYLDAPTFVVEPKLLHSSIFDNRVDSLNAYKWFIKSVAHLLKEDSIDAKQLTADIDAMLDFEASLMKITTDQRNKTTKAVKLRNLSHLYPKIRWSLLIREISAITNVTFSPETEILVNDDHYYSKLSSVLHSTSKRVIANYFAWRLIEYFGKYSSDVLRSHRFQFEKSTSATTSLTARWQFCVDTLTSKLPHVVSRMYIDNYFDESSRSDLFNMISMIKRQLRYNIESSVWMDEQTQDEALNKLHHMFNVLGYQSWIKNDSQLEAYYFELPRLRSANFLDAIVELDKANTHREFRKLVQNESRESMEVMPATDVNAYYYLRRNLIAFPAALLQKPLYTYGLPSSLNFGAIGFVIGHELLHAFDEEGKQYNKYGNYKNWWTNVTSMVYENRSHCFIEHYSRLTDPQSLLRIDAKLTKEENIADSLGLRLAYNAFRADIAMNGEQSLIALSEFTAEQLFFIAFAQLWCVNETMESKWTTVQYGPHSPEYFRVMGSLLNSRSFFEAFHCTNHSRMNPNSECRLW